MKNLKYILLGIFFTVLCFPAHSARKVFEGTVNGWLFNYGVGAINTIVEPKEFSASSFSVGAVDTPTCARFYLNNLTLDDFQTFQKFYLVAKATGISMRVNYDDVSCELMQFALSAN